MNHFYALFAFCRGSWLPRTARRLILLLLPCLLVGQDLKFVNAQLPYHQAVLDQQGKLLAWYEPEKNRGYDKVLHLGWDFIEHRVPRDHKTGQKVYLVNS